MTSQQAFLTTSPWWHLLYQGVIRLVNAWLSLFLWPKSAAKYYKHRLKKDARGVISNRSTILCMCPSLGEYEAVKSILLHLKSQLGQSAIEICFFSSSGFDYISQRDVGLWDAITYTPLEDNRSVNRFYTARNVRGILISSLMIWPTFLKYAQIFNVPYFFIGAQFKPGLSKMLYHRIMHHYIAKAEGISLTIDRDKKGGKLYRRPDQRLPDGRPRLDSIIGDLKDSADLLADFDTYQRDKTIVLGSTHLCDEEMLIPLMSEALDRDMKVILAPHDPGRLYEISTLLARHNLEGSTEIEKSPDILIIDQVGLLKYLYQHAKFAYVGGGYDKGLIAGCIVWTSPIPSKQLDVLDLLDLGLIASLSTDDILSQGSTSLFDREISPNQMTWIDKHRGISQQLADAISDRLTT